MPASYRIEPAIGCVFSRAHGTVTDADVLGHQQTLCADTDFRADLNQVYDLREVTQVEVTTEGIKTLAARTPFRGDVRRALVVNTPLTVGLARMYIAYAGDEAGELRLFEDPEQARSWAVGDRQSAAGEPGATSHGGASG